MKNEEKKIPLNGEEKKSESAHFFDDKIQYYWTELYMAVIRRDLNRVRECYHAIKALHQKHTIKF